MLFEELQSYTQVAVRETDCGVYKRGSPRRLLLQLPAASKLASSTMTGGLTICLNFPTKNRL